MEYKLDQVHKKLQQFADKMNSDYFPLPELLNHFETAAYKFIGEKLRNIEKTQEVTDDIRSLIVPGKLVITKDPNDQSRWVAAVPVNYVALVAYDVVYDDGSRCRRADLIKQAEYSTAANNPYKKPEKHFPLILQENNLFQIDCGKTAVPAFMSIKFCKKPSFAKTNEKDKRIVNLPDQAIENIILSTVTSLFNRTADERTQSNHQLEEAYRKFTR